MQQPVGGATDGDLLDAAHGRADHDEAGLVLLGGADQSRRHRPGIDPDELGGSAWEAAITSVILFALGAILPVAPFFFASGMVAVFWSIGLSVVGLFALGAVITLFTGRGLLYSGLRMVLFGLLAAGVTFGIGRLIGVSISG